MMPNPNVTTEYDVKRNEWTALYVPTLQKGFGDTEEDAKKNLLWWIGRIGIHPPYYQGTAPSLKKHWGLKK